MPQQKKAAFNARHRFLADLLVALGLDSRSDVLELGCGIGVMTTLVAALDRGGRIVAVDLSPASIETAKVALAWATNVEWAASDVVDYRASAEARFDFITLFDVIEHIPVEQHPDLFLNVATQMGPGARLVVNIPSPAYIDYLREREPEKLQIVDQALPADQILRSAYAAGLELVFFSAYGLWVQDDYQVMVFRRSAPFDHRPLPPVSRWLQLWRKLLVPLARWKAGRHPLWWLGVR